MATAEMPPAAVEPYTADAPAPGSIGRVYAEEQAASVLDALVNGPRAWMTAEELADALDWPVETVEVAVESGESIGWLCRWRDCPQGEAITLTPLSASILNVAVGPYATWEDAGSDAALGTYSKPRAPRRDAGTIGGDEESGGTFGWCVDPRAVDPATAAEEAERLATLARGSSYTARLLSGTAMPARVVGTRPIWPAAIVGGVCPGCDTGPTDPDCVCLICHRSGLDLLVRAKR